MTGESVQCGGRAGLRSYALIVVASVLWGATFALAKIVADSGVHPFAVTFWQAVGSVFLLSAYCAMRRSRVPLDVPHLKFYALLGMLGTAVPGVLFYAAASRLPAGVLSISVATVPMMTYAAALVIGLDTLTARRISGLALGVAAVVLIVAPEASLPDRSAGVWVLVAVLACTCYAVENIYAAVRGLGTDPAALVAGMSAAAALWLAPFALSTAGADFPFRPWGEPQVALALLATVSAAAYAMFLAAIRTAGPVFASQTGYLVTLTGVGWGIVLLGERHSAWVWAALTLMLAGMALVTPRATPARVSDHPGDD